MLGIDRADRAVVDRLPHAEQEHDRVQPPDGQRTGGHQHQQCGGQDRPQRVRDRERAAAVDPVDQDAGRDREEQPGQQGERRDARHQERVLRQLHREQRGRGPGDAVTEARGEVRREQVAEPGADARRRRARVVVDPLTIVRGSQRGCGGRRGRGPRHRSRRRAEAPMPAAALACACSRVARARDDRADARQLRDPGERRRGRGRARRRRRAPRTRGPPPRPGRSRRPRTSRPRRRPRRAGCTCGGRRRAKVVSVVYLPLSRPLAQRHARDDADAGLAPPRAAPRRAGLSRNALRMICTLATCRVGRSR